MPVRPPTAEDIRSLGAELSLDLTPREVEAFRDKMADRMETYETVREYDQPAQEGQTTARRRNSRSPASGEADPTSPWQTRCEVVGADDGPLDGWDVAIKDNISVAGVEMTCGSQVLSGHVPNGDAPAVSRLLDAGARIVGKTAMDDMAMTIDGHSAFGAVTNPVDDAHLAGGSSAGSAVVVATGDVDAALGTDQGGSIRIPASYCGVVGHKPTYGLVPYTGCVGLEHTVDHVGPIARDVETAARMLSVLAGGDGMDPRQPPEVPVQPYEDALDGEISDLSIGLLEEGFDQPDNDPGVNRSVRDGIETLGDLGATIEEVSVPMHADARAFHSVSTAEGLLALVRGDGATPGTRGWYDVDWIESFGAFRRARGGQFPPNFKLALLMGAYASQRYHSSYYARAKNLCRELGAKYDALFETYDLLALPTTPETAPEYEPDLDPIERLERDKGGLSNTCAFNRTGHPALSVPVEPVDGLPVGLMLVGSAFDDATVLDAGYALEER